MSFKVGDRVTCIDADFQVAGYGGERVVLGKTYTVRAIEEQKHPEAQILLLESVHHPKNPHHNSEIGLCSDRFVLAEDA